MKNITINFKEATVFVNIYRDNVVDYNITLNNLNIHAVIVVDENGELTDNIRFYSYNYYCVFPNEDEYEIELSENYKNFVLDMAKHFHHRVDDKEFSMLGYTRDVINEKTTKRFVARTINLKYFEEV